jgi:hypothetical protein
MAIEVLQSHNCPGCSTRTLVIRYRSESSLDGIVLRMKTPEETGAELAKMSDEELTEHGKTLRKFCRRVAEQKIEKEWLIQLSEARAEWKRRHPTNVS